MVRQAQSEATLLEPPVQAAEPNRTMSAELDNEVK